MNYSDGTKEVEAIQMTADPVRVGVILNWANADGPHIVDGHNYETGDTLLHLTTNGAVVVAGDWIIKGKEGNCSVVSDAEFAGNYTAI